MMKKNRKHERQEQAIERQSKYDKLSLDERLKLAQSRRGNSTKEIDKLRRNVKWKEYWQ